MSFDPFGDFDERGYLRNTAGAKEASDIKELEHLSFVSNLRDTLLFLSGERTISYQTFLDVHKLIFSNIYPWAGKDRFELTPDLGVSKGKEGSPGFTKFANPYEIESAINYGLSLAKNKEKFKSKPGQVMGNLAFAHPFLDGNGRTLILVYMELCHRAGFSIEWSKTDKNKYLINLSREIYDPSKGSLDSYLMPFVSKKLDRNYWHNEIISIKGLSGLDDERMVYKNGDDNNLPLSPGDFVRQNAYRMMNQEEGLSKGNKILGKLNNSLSKDGQKGDPEP